MNITGIPLLDAALAVIFVLGVLYVLVLFVRKL